MGSTFGRILRVTTFGESHGTAVGALLENCPAGLKLSEKDIQPDLDRRRPGQSNIVTPRSELDKVSILSGIFKGKTIGSPIAMMVWNKNTKEKDYLNFKEIYRPSHADYTYQMRYGHRSYLGGGRSSARSTIGIVAAGSIAKKILHIKEGIQICAYVSQVQDKKLTSDFKLPPIKKLKKEIEKNPIRCPDQELAKEISDLIQKVRQKGDSLGGVIQLRIENVPAGIGDPTFDRLDACLAHAMLAIPATKGVEIGSGFEGVQLTGSEHNDIFYRDKGNIKTYTNHSGGMQGGISNGEAINMRIAFKPTSTINKEQTSIDQKGKNVKLKVKGRHDPCVLPRAVSIVEAFASLVLADQYLLFKLASFDKI